FYAGRVLSLFDNRCMASLANPFISGRHKRLVSFLIWLAIFVAGTVFLGWLAVVQVQEFLRREVRTEVAQLEKLRLGIDKAFNDIEAEVTARPCSSEFRGQLRRIAFRPDGISEFLYAPKGYAECSTTRMRFEPPVSFGPPDVEAVGPMRMALWV